MYVDFIYKIWTQPSYDYIHLSYLKTNNDDL